MENSLDDASLRRVSSDLSTALREALLMASPSKNNLRRNVLEKTTRWRETLNKSLGPLPASAVSFTSSLTRTFRNTGENESNGNKEGLIDNTEEEEEDVEEQEPEHLKRSRSFEMLKDLREYKHRGSIQDEDDNDDDEEEDGDEEDDDEPTNHQHGENRELLNRNRHHRSSSVSSGEFSKDDNSLSSSNESNNPHSIPKSDSMSSLSSQNLTPLQSFQMWSSKIAMNSLFALILFLIVLPNALGFGSILTSHPKLRGFFPVAIKLSILSNILHQLVATIWSKLVYNVPMVQETNVLFLALMANKIAEHAGDDSTIEPTLMFVLAVSSILMGIAYFLIGKFHLVSAVQYIPYPVMAGFLVAVGLYLVEAAIAIMTDLPFETLEEMVHTFHTGRIWVALPGIGVAILLMIIEKFVHHYSIMPTVLIVPLFVFWIVVAIVGTPIQELRDNHFLFNPIEVVPWYSVWDGWSWHLIDFSLLPRLIPDFIAMVILNILNTTLNISGLEFVMSKEIDSGKELMVAGIGNIAAGCTGGLGGSITFSLTAIGAKNNNNRILGIVIMIFGTIMFVSQFPLLDYIPRFFFGAVLFYIGAEMVFAWLYKPFSSIPLFEFGLLLITATALMVFGNNIGLPISLAISALFFAWQYSHIKPIRKTYHGMQMQSKVQRPYLQRQILSKYSKSIHVIQLQGYLFFGSSVKLVNHIREMIVNGRDLSKDSPAAAATVRSSPFRGDWIKNNWEKITSRFHQTKYHAMTSDDNNTGQTLDLEEIKIDNKSNNTSHTNNKNPPPNSLRPRRKHSISESVHHISEKMIDFIDGGMQPRSRKRLSYLIVDFQMVHGVDSTAVSSFNKILQMAQENNITLIFTFMGSNVEKMFRKHKILDDDVKFLKTFPDLDLALEAVENKIIKRRIKLMEEKKLSEEIQSTPINDYNPSFISLLVSFLPENMTEEQCVSLVNKFFSRKKLTRGEVLIQSGAKVTSFYFVKSGELSFYSKNDDGERARLFKTTKGTFIGETSMMLNIPHDTSVEADEDCVLYEITRARFKIMEIEAPFLALALYTAMMQSLSLTVHIFMRRMQTK